MSEWLSAVEDFQRKSGNGAGHTSGEIAAQLGRTPEWVREHILHPAAKAGRLAHSDGRRESPIDGRMCVVKVYRLLPAPGRKMTTRAAIGAVNKRHGKALAKLAK